MTTLLATPAGFGIRFTEPTLLIWLLAVMLPLVIAWWTRRRLPQVAFGPLAILRRSARKRHRSWSSWQWPLLLRMLMLLALIAAAARPAWRAATDGGGRLSVSRLWLVTAGESTTASDPSVAGLQAAVDVLGFPKRSGSLQAAVAAAARNDLIVLGDGLAPTPVEADRLVAWVRRGGGVMVLLGPDTLASVDWPRWRRVLAEHTGVFAGEPRDTRGGRLVVSPALQSPSQRASAGHMAELPGPTVERLVDLSLPAGSTGLTPLAVVEPSGATAALVRTVGRGAVTMSALPLTLTGTAATGPADETTRWSDLAAWPVLLPYLSGLRQATRAACLPLAATWPPSLRWFGTPTVLVVLLAALTLTADWWLTAGGWRSGCGYGVVAVVLVAVSWRATATGVGAADTQAATPAVNAAERLTAAVPPLCWPGERLEIPVTVWGEAGASGRVALDGPDGRFAEQPFTLTVSSAGLPETSCGRADLTLGWDVASSQPEGSCQLQVRLLPGESAAPAVPDTAPLELATTIAPRPARLLLLEGEPRFEYRFLNQALAGDQRFEVESRLLAHQPPARRGTIDWSQYDAVWLGDVIGQLPTERAASSPPLLHDQVDQVDQVLAELGEAVVAGRLGLAWSPGQRFRFGGFAAGAATDWLPLTVDGPLAAPQQQGLPVRSRPAGVLAGWLPADRPRLGTAYDLLMPVGLQPTTVVLATAGPLPSGGTLPAVVLGRVGAGQVLGHCVETWRWRATEPAASHALHEAYWRQALTRLATPPLLRKLGRGQHASAWPVRASQPLVSPPAGEHQAPSRHPLLEHLLLAVAVLAAGVAWWSAVQTQTAEVLS
jgi:hypothetical protein